MAIPNGERVLAEYLRSAQTIRVVNKTPSDQTEPWIRISMLDAPSLTEPVDHLIQFLFQIDIFSGKDGGRPESNDIGIETRDVLRDMPGQTDEAVTSGVECVGDAALTDTEYTPQREYRSQTWQIWMHS